MPPGPNTCLAGLALLVAGCGREPAPGPPAPAVLASFYPVTYFAQRIAQGTVKVECPLPEGADPIFWQPDRPTLERFQAATLVLVNGASFEHWVDQVSLPQSRVVDTAHALADRFLTFETVTHSHGAGGAHTHTGTDGHTWLDPNNARVQARAIHDALLKAFPEHAAAFAAGLAALEADLGALHAEFEAVTGRLGTTTLLASHPAYNYVAARYGWKVHNIVLDPEGQPGAKELDALGAARGPGKTVLLWESAPNAGLRAAVDALGVTSVVFSPCESLAPADAAAGLDYLKLMHANLQRLGAALQS